MAPQRAGSPMGARQVLGKPGRIGERRQGFANSPIPEPLWEPPWLPGSLFCGHFSSSGSGNPAPGVGLYLPLDQRSGAGSIHSVVLMSNLGSSIIIDSFLPHSLRVPTFSPNWAHPYKANLLLCTCSKTGLVEGQQSPLQNFSWLSPPLLKLGPLWALSALWNFLSHANQSVELSASPNYCVPGKQELGLIHPSTTLSSQSSTVFLQWTFPGPLLCAQKSSWHWEYRDEPTHQAQAFPALKFHMRDRQETQL
jgi:hypothetical protein